MEKPKVKICCIQSVKEAELAIQYGASALGLVSEMPSGPGVISLEEIAEIVRYIPKSVDTFLLSSRLTADEIITQQKSCGTNTIQIVDSVDTEVYIKLKSKLPAVKLVQVIHVSDKDSVAEAVSASEYVDAILLDSGNQKLEVKELGGTGRTHDWSLSKSIVESVNVPVYLAGGLKSDNVVDAVRTVHPYGIDLCSGVRKYGKLNTNLLKEFFHKVDSV
ncbi:phosphoribosylanthranilate isomerase [Bacteroidota bacterium]